MDNNSQRLVMGAAGVASGPSLYVEDVFSTWLYTGNGSTQTITNGIDLSGKGGLVWTKTRSGAGAANALFDTARGSNKYILSNTADQEYSISNLLSFTASGFTLGTSTVFNNENSTSYASWSFRKAAKFFDIVTYTGSGSNRAIAHNLGSTPGCILIKRLDNTGDWQVYHRSLANTEYLVLNSTAAKATGATRWNSTTPTSSEFSLGTDASVNASGGTYVAYLFAHNAGGFGESGNDDAISCGTFTTDGSGNATVTLGWESQFVLIKRTDSTQSGSWFIVDTIRKSSFTGTYWLFANTSAAENGVEATNGLYPTATGFVTGGSLTGANATYVYIAIRRGPMKTPTDATKVFSANTSTGPSTTEISIGFPSDLAIYNLRTGSDANSQVADRLRGFAINIASDSKTLQTTSTAAETNAQIGYEFWNTSFKIGVFYGDGNNVFYSFGRAPNFFDVVGYTGTGLARTVNHNLKVAPELIIVKARSSVGREWLVYSSALGNTNQIRFNASDAAVSGSVAWNSTSPTASVFSLGGNINVNLNGSTFIAYLFASCPGVSKVGSYTGTGATLSVNCGFTAGARFVLIKRTDSTGDWYVWDTARGIIAANDPYLLLNSTAAEVTNTDYIDPLAAGFQISSTAPAAINANGGTYIYLAIA